MVGHRLRTIGVYEFRIRPFGELALKFDRDPKPLIREENIDHTATENPLFCDESWLHTLTCVAVISGRSSINRRDQGVSQRRVRRVIGLTLIPGPVNTQADKPELGREEQL